MSASTHTRALRLLQAMNFPILAENLCVTVGSAFMPSKSIGPLERFMPGDLHQEGDLHAGHYRAQTRLPCQLLLPSQVLTSRPRSDFHASFRLPCREVTFKPRKDFHASFSVPGREYGSSATSTVYELGRAQHRTGQCYISCGVVLACIHPDSALMQSRLLRRGRPLLPTLPLRHVFTLQPPYASPLSCGSSARFEVTLSTRSSMPCSFRSSLMLPSDSTQSTSRQGERFRHASTSLQ
jgi:hypothetical protein